MAYTPGLNGGRINASLSGNSTSAGGGYSLVSTGTLYLAGGNNVTLSQNANTVTISAAAQSVVPGIQSIQASNTTYTTGNVIFSNANGLSFGSSAGGAITASYTVPTNFITTARASTDALGLNTAQTNVTWTANSGGLSLNASGYAGTGTTFAGTNVSASMTHNSAGLNLALSAGAGGGGGFSAGISGGNVAGNTGTVGSQVVFAGGNNITLSGATAAGGSATVSISAANQTVQPGIQSIQASNTTYTTGNVIFSNANGLSFGSSAGGAITASYTVPSVPTQTVQTSNIVVPSAGTQTATSGTVSFANSNGVTFGMSGSNQITASVQTNYLTTARASTDALGLNTAQTNVTWTANSSGLSLNAAGYAGTGTTFAGANLSGSITQNSAGLNLSMSAAAAGGGGGATGSYYDNMIQQSSISAINYTSLSTGMFNHIIIQPLDPSNEQFPYAITASTAYLNFSANATATIASSSHTSTVYVGLYTRANSTQLSLVNSVSSSWGMAANASNSGAYNGARYLSIHSSLWSAQPALSQNVRYYFGIMFRTSNYSGSSGSSLANSIAGMYYGQSAQRSGYLGVAGSSGTSYNAWHPFMGVHSITTHTAMLGTIANSDINKVSAYGNFIPQIIFDGGGGLIN